MSVKKESRAQSALWLILLLLASLVSYKLGQRSQRGSEFSSPKINHESHADLLKSEGAIEGEAQALEKSELDISDPLQMRQSELTCPPIECPPCECGEPSPPPKKKGKKAPRPKESAPVDRQRLLAWVKRFSPRLKRCRDAGQPIYRLHTEVKLSAKRDKILSAKVRGSDVPSSALRCVEADLKRWPAPTHLPETHPQKLIFSLQLD